MATYRHLQVEYHPYVFKASSGIIDLHKEHNIVTTSYGGLTPIVRARGKGELDPVLEKISKRLTETAGKPISEGQVLQLWLRNKGVPIIT